MTLPWAALEDLVLTLHSHCQVLFLWIQDSGMDVDGQMNFIFLTYKEVSTDTKIFVVMVAYVLYTYTCIVGKFGEPK